MFFFSDTATTEIYTLSLHDALPISDPGDGDHRDDRRHAGADTETLLALRHRGGDHRDGAAFGTRLAAVRAAAPADCERGPRTALPEALQRVRRESARARCAMQRPVARAGRAGRLLGPDADRESVV